MMIRMHQGQFIFTACSLNLSRQFICFHEGITWAFVQKLAAACAADMG